MKINLDRLKQDLSAQTFKNDLVSNNLANINTIGYKRDIMFTDMIDIFDSNYDNKNVKTEFTQGTMKETGNPLDVAFSGKGFFVIENNGEEYYTRDGHFTVNSVGNLTTAEGFNVMGQGGVINFVRRMVELRCNAGKIPKMLEFDLIDSEIGDSIKISNIKLPEGVKPTITDRDFVIATLVPPTVEAEPEETTEEKEEGEEKTDETVAAKESQTESKEESSEVKTDKKEDKK